MSDPGDILPGISNANEDAGRWVLIASFPRAFQAHLAACALEGQNIPTRPGRPPLPPTVMGCELMVRADDYPRAVEILRQTPAKDFLNSDMSDTRPTLDYGRPSRKLPHPWWVYALLILALDIALVALAWQLVNRLFHD